MNDTKTSAAAFQLPNQIPPRSPISATDRSWLYWLKKVLVCNPFYLASAALLLFGLYRVSVDPNFLSEEIGQLKFNFTALQLYEFLLVGTAMFLARRLIEYDARLLVTLGNLLVFVPFILVSQAGLIERWTVWVFCGVASACAVARSMIAQRFVAVMRFPRKLSLMGIVFLAANAAWTVIYCALHQHKWGTKYESGAAFEVNRWSWLVLLPALIALANLLPSPRGDGKSPVQGRRFPVGILCLWLLGTTAHLYSLGYVYDFDLHRDWLAPAAWMLAWTFHLRSPEYLKSLPQFARRLSFVLPLLVIFIAASETANNILFTLSVINLLAFGALAWRERGNKLAQLLTMLSFATAMAAMPATLFNFLPEWLRRTDLIGLVLMACVMVATLLTRNPKAAVAGAIAAAVAGGTWRDHSGDALHWAAQCGVVFFLLHSLRWRDHEHYGAKGARILAIAGWVVHSAAWLQAGAVMWHPLVVASVVFCICGVRAWVFQRWSPVAVPLAALAVAVAGPLNLLVAEARTAPLGVLALVGSLALFAVGTAAALTKQHWFKIDDAG